MATLIASDIGADSFFCSENHQADLDDLPVDRRDALFPFVLNAKLTGAELSPRTRALSSEAIRLGEDEFHWLTGEPDPDVWATLVPGQRLAPLTPDRRDLLVAALEHLATEHPDAYPTVRTFARLICWVELEFDANGDEPLGGGTSPLLPFAIFMSNSAMRGLAPTTAAAHRSRRILAENLVHEATHNRLGIYIAEQDVFTDDYDAETSPKIESHWHREPDGSHPFWAADRCLHAACVYNELFPFRLQELADEGCEPFEREAFVRASEIGAGALDHLTRSLLRNEDQFTPQGVELIREVRARAEEVLADWAEYSRA